MFMLFGLEKKALLLVFVLLLARTAHFETFNRENRIRSLSYDFFFPGTAQLRPSHSRPPRLASELSKAYLEVLRRGSCPLILHSNVRLPVLTLLATAPLGSCDPSPLIRLFHCCWH